METARRMMDDDTASAALGIELVELDPGRAVCRMKVTGQMINGHALCHGGYVFLLADTAFACACNTYGPVTVAGGADITFVSPVREGDVVALGGQRVHALGQFLEGARLVGEVRRRGERLGHGPSRSGDGS
ncbi:hotdog fold thioesterase [Nonomuraea sp. NPDC050478]|uniref:hotdog fold thioesterase n=1 Tax=Nonomuraea sp. NPDC050478 TaxID=3364365 RepID=UPI0037B9E508